MPVKIIVSKIVITILANSLIYVNNKKFHRLHPEKDACVSVGKVYNCSQELLLVLKL